jgi:hypothetical protein
MKTHSYDKYSIENDQFFYDEGYSKNTSILKQESELFNEDDYVPGKLIRVKRISKSDSEDWQILVNNTKTLLITGNRFSSIEKEFLRTPAGVLFIINGVKQGWKSVSDFKRQIKDLI